MTHMSVGIQSWSKEISLIVHAHALRNPRPNANLQATLTYLDKLGNMV